MKSSLTSATILSLMMLSFVGSVVSSPARANEAIGRSCLTIFDSIQAPAIVTNLTPERFQFSYESEYTFDEAAPILRDYAPAAEKISHEAWLAMSDADHLAWLKAQFADKPEFATESGLFLINPIEGLPEQLVVDSTGNLEIVVNPPQGSYFAWEKIVEMIVGRYGAGSQQAMVSKPRSEGFSPAVSKAQSVKENLGWLVYTNLFDTITKLESGVERFTKDPTKLVAQSFDHPFLGPMTKIKRDVMESYLDGNSRLEKYDEDSKHFVRKSDSSFKYTGGPSYRPDIAGPHRWSWEIRNAHRDLDDLKYKVLRDVVAHASGLSAYTKFAIVPAFDSVHTFDQMPIAVQHTLRKLFPSKADPRFNYAPSDLIALESFRNFAFPESDFSSLSRALTSSPEKADALNQKIKRARFYYDHSLRTISDQVALGQISEGSARAKVMGQLAIWAHNSGLATAFEAKAKSLGHDIRFSSASATSGQKAS